MYRLKKKTVPKTDWDLDRFEPNKVKFEITGDGAHQRGRKSGVWDLFSQEKMHLIEIKWRANRLLNKKGRKDER